MIGRKLKYIVTVRQANGEYKYVIREGENKDYVFGRAAQEFGTYNVGRVVILSIKNIELMQAKRIGALEDHIPAPKYLEG